MFCLSSCCGKKSTAVVSLVADKSKQTRSSQKSLAVPDAPSASNKGERTPWRYRLFGRPMKRRQVEPGRTGQQSLVCHSTTHREEQCLSTLHRAEQCHSTLHRNDLCHSTVHQDEQCPFTPQRAEQCHSTSHRDEQCHSTPQRAEQCHSTPQRDEQCHSTPQRDEQCHSIPHRNEQCPSAPQRDEQCHSIPHRNEQCHSTPQRDEQGHSTPHRGEQCPSTPERAEQCPSNPQRDEQCHSTPQRDEQCHSTSQRDEQCHSTPQRDEQCHSTPERAEQCHSTPRRAEQCHSTPQRAEQCPSNPQRDEQCHSSPRGEEQCHSTPRREEQCHSTPRRDEQCHSTPRRDEQCHSTPRRDEQCHSTPRRDEQCHSTPHRDEQCHSTPHRDEQCHSTPQWDEQCHYIPSFGQTLIKTKAKKPWLWCKKRRQVVPDSGQQSLDEQCHSTPHKDEVVELKGPTEEEERVLVEDKTVLQVVPKKWVEDAVSTKKTIRQQQVKCLGFPNPAQICYINSCLQSLLTLEDFVRAISCQEQVWGLFEESALMRSFMDIKRSHSSRDFNHKIHLLGGFKKVVSDWAPEFQDPHQKDAHEFLTSVLEHMRCLGQQLQVMATSMGRSYSCPVEDHLVFKMLNTRTCKRCGKGSNREEVFTNLSLDLVPGAGTVELMLQEYLMESELEYNCKCGGITSGQRWSFVTLPRVLVLHLKRFRFTPTFQLRKVHDPIIILRDLVVSSNEDGGCYSLMSTISHIGPTARSGHYVCDGVDPDVGVEDPTDRWFCYNDAEVTETNGASVCNRRERNAYILFYKRQD